MNLLFMLPIAIFVAATTSVNAEDGVSCSTGSEMVGAQVELIKNKYTKIANEQQREIQAKARSIMDESPDATGPEHYVNADIDFRENIREFRLDLPSVTMKSQQMSMDLPQVTMVTQTWSWDIPEITVRQECHAGPDELVREAKTCHNDWPSFDYPCDEWRTRRGADICYGVPVATNRREEIKLDVPEVKSARTEWILDVPEITVKTETIKINIPDIVVKNIQLVAVEQKRQADELSSKAKDGSAAISQALTKEMALENRKLVANAFTCQKNQLRSKIKEAYIKIEEVESAISASYNQAEASKAIELVASFENALTSIKASKTKMLVDYKAARRDLAKKEQSALESIKISQEVASK